MRRLLIPLYFFILYGFVSLLVAEEESKAELPHWPIGFKLPKEMMKDWKRAKRMMDSPKADVLVWIPPEAKKLRALFLIPSNTDSKIIGEFKMVRDICAKHEIGIIYLRHFGGQVIERSDPPDTADKAFAWMLKLVAEKTGIVEVNHAPFITLGKSSRGRFPFRTTWWFPKRVIASISYHGETPTWPMPDWSKVGDESVMHLAINGLTEWDGTWYRHVRPSLLNYHRKTNWLAHQMVLYGVGHGNYIDAHGSAGWGMKVPGKNISCQRVWGYIAGFIDEAMLLRVPTDRYPTEAMIPLKQIDRSSGYLIHPRAIEEMMGLKNFAFRRDKAGEYKIIKWPDEVTPVYDNIQGNIERSQWIRPASEVPEAERADYMWVPNAKLARWWLQFHDLYKQKDKVLPKEK